MHKENLHKLSKMDLGKRGPDFILLYYYFLNIHLFTYILATPCGMRNPDQKSNMCPPALAMWGLKHWTTREVPTPPHTSFLVAKEICAYCLSLGNKSLKKSLSASGSLGGTMPRWPE